MLEVFFKSTSFQVEVMKSNVASRIKQFEQDLDKFAARWKQLKPGDDALDGDQKKCLEAVQTIKDKKREFEELHESKAILQYVLCF